MELTRDHREALLNELTKAKEDRENNNNVMRATPSEHPDYVQWMEISIFLADERIKLIEKSLIDNNIDY